jgi:hypothetical protein
MLCPVDLQREPFFCLDLIVSLISQSDIQYSDSPIAKTNNKQQQG